MWPGTAGRIVAHFSASEGAAPRLRVASSAATFVVLSLLSVIGPAGCGREADRPVVKVRFDDPAMQNAVAEAQRTLSQFIDYFEHRPVTPVAPQFYVKAVFDMHGRREHMWVEVERRADGEFHGYLADKPLVIKNLKAGTRVKVKETAIEDWLIVDENREPSRLGGFTEKALDRLKPNPTAARQR